MELHEINRALNDIENPAFEEPKTAEQTPDFKEPETSDDADFSSAQKPEESKVYSDYSGFTNPARLRMEQGRYLRI